MKYNIVLLPDLDSCGFMLDLAKEFSEKQSIKTSYLLREEKSVPHASVFQFESSESLDSTLWDVVEESWQEVLASTKQTKITCHLQNKVNYKHDLAGPFAGVTWAELLVDKTTSPEVMQFHNLLLLKLTALGVHCLNAHGARYTPHFTLFNATTATLNSDGLTTDIPRKYSQLQTVQLTPALGVANEQWELVDVLVKVPESGVTDTSVKSRLFSSCTSALSEVLEAADKTKRP